MSKYDLKLEFFTDERLAELFGYFTSLVKMASPVALISVALTMAGLVLTVVVTMIRKGIHPDKDKKDRDYDIDYYD